MASHLARFQTDDPLLGECDPWAGMEFFTPQGPGRAAYRPDGPLPKDFPRVCMRARYRGFFMYNQAFPDPWCFVPLNFEGYVPLPLLFLVPQALAFRRCVQLSYVCESVLVVLLLTVLFGINVCDSYAG